MPSNYPWEEKEEEEGKNETERKRKENRWSSHPVAAIWGVAGKTTVFSGRDWPFLLTEQVCVWLAQQL